MTEISHLFDPAYHTFERVRETSSLFTAILGVAARYRRPDLASPLLEHAERLMQRSLYDGQVDLAFVQTNIVMVHWKHPDDKSAYMKLGMAFRAAAQLRLGATMFQPLPVEVTAARARLDRERTWLGERYNVCWDPVADRSFIRSAISVTCSWQQLMSSIRDGLQWHIPPSCDVSFFPSTVSRRGGRLAQTTPAFELAWRSAHGHDVQVSLVVF